MGVELSIKHDQPDAVLAIVVRGDITPEQAWILIRATLGRSADRPWNLDWDFYEPAEFNPIPDLPGVNRMVGD